MIKSLIAEVFAIIAYILMSPTLLLGNTPAIREPLTQRPILLVHGYLGNASNWFYHRHRLRKAGFCVYTLNLGIPFYSIEHYAKKVQKKAEQIAKETGRDDLALVGYSMGGLVVTYYATTLAPEGSVTDVITLGSPMQGTKVANIGIGACTKQMRYQSPFVKNLEDKAKQMEGTRFYHIGSDADLIIRPTNAAFSNIPGAKKDMVTNLGHYSYLISRDVSDKLISYLH